MQCFVDEVLTPYFNAQKTHIGCPQSQKSLWIINVWAVHCSNEFIGWMCDNHLTILIDFIPGGCTGIGQPLDVGINRPFKQSIKVSYHAELVNNFLGQMKQNQALEFNTYIGPLRDTSVGWLWNAYQVVQREELVKKVGSRHLKFTGSYCIGICEV